MLEVQQVCLSLQNRLILQNTTAQFSSGKISVLLGPSGCGKSTLLRVLAGLLRPDQGHIEGNQQSMSFVFQEPRLLSWLNVSENILLPSRLSGAAKDLSQELPAWLQTVGLQGTQALFPHQLSGGMKMRVAILRALITSPQILFMDEPFAALDEVTRHQLQDQLLTLQKQLSMTIVFVTHSVPEATYLADRMLLMAPGGHIRRSEELAQKQPRPSRDSLEFLTKTAELSKIYQQLLAGGADVRV